MKPVIALVGRPNVGKSALFNRIVRKQAALVDDIPGVTRDRIYADADWGGSSFVLIDTGGFQVGAQQMADMIREQAEAAMGEADVIVLVVDARTGITPEDREISQILRAGGKPVVVAPNKVDTPELIAQCAEFYALGLGEPMPVSAIHGLGVGDLLDKTNELLPAAEEDEPSEQAVRLAVVGRPNVGKSSLVNSLLKQPRMIVSDMPGTTRDAIDVMWHTPEGRFVLVDTAGLRRRGRIDLELEKQAAARSLRAIARSDVALVLVDATEGVLEQDKRIAGYAHRLGRASIILVNKWDLASRLELSKAEFGKTIRSKIGFLDYAPIECISATGGHRLSRLPRLVSAVYDSYSRTVQTSLLNRVIQDAVRVSPPPSVRGKQLNVFYVTQVKTKPPTLLIFVNNKQLVNTPYQRYLEGRLRDAFSFEGTPIRFVWRSRE